MSEARPRVVPFGDAAVLVELGERIDPLLNARAHALAAALRGLAADAGLGEPVPAYASVLVPFDPLRTTSDRVTALVSEAAGRAAVGDRGASEEDALPPIEIFVRYGGAEGAPPATQREDHP